MLPAPATADAKAFVAQLKRIGISPRELKLEALEARWKGLTYDVQRRPSWWDATVPLRERAPCVVDPLARVAGQRLVSLVFGEGRFPAASVGNGGASMYGVALSETDAQLLSEAVAAIVKQAKLKLRMREGLEQGLMSGTGVFLGALRGGKLAVDILPAKWCTPRFGRDGEVTRLEVRFRYPDPDDPDKHWWYRRVLDGTRDVTYRPAECRPDGREPAWVEDPAQTFALEFCPVVWVKNLPDPGDPGDLDGVALHEGLDDELEALDFSLSQRHRNAQYNGEPQTVITGASAGDLAGDRGAESAGPLRGWSWFPRAVAGNRESGGGTGLKKAPGTIWTINKDGAGAQLLESTGAGATILQGDADGLRRTILDAMGVVIPDADKITAGDISGAALRILHAPMLALADNLRECWGEALVQVLGMLLRLLTTQQARTGGVWLPLSVAPQAPPTASPPGAAPSTDEPQAPTAPSALMMAPPQLGLPALQALLARFYVPASEGRRWCCPPLDLEWGDYFEASWSERLAATQAAQAAEMILSKRTVIQALAPTWGVEDIEAELREANHAEAQKTERAQMMATALGGGTPSEPDDETAADNAAGKAAAFDRMSPKGTPKLADQ